MNILIFFTDYGFRGASGVGWMDGIHESLNESNEKG